MVDFLIFDVALAEKGPGVLIQLAFLFIFFNRQIVNEALCDFVNILLNLSFRPKVYQVFDLLQIQTFASALRFVG